MMSAEFAFGIFVCGGNSPFPGAEIGFKAFDGKGIAGNKRHISCGGIVVGVRHARGVGKMRALTADFRRLLVHKLHKGKLASGGGVRKTHGTVVGGFHHCAVKKIFYFAGFAFGKRKVSAALVIACRLCGKGVFVLWVKNFNFCDTCRLHTPVGAAADQKLAAVGVHNAICFRDYFAWVFRSLCGNFKGRGGKHRRH